MGNTQSKNQAFKDQIFQKNVLVQNLIGEPKKNAYLEFNLMHLLTPNEFFVYTYLLNAPSDFAPNYEKFAQLIKVSSKGTITNIIRKLTKLNLVSVEKMGTFYVWTVNYRETEKSVYVQKVEEDKIVSQTHRDRSDIMREIQRLEEIMENESNPESIFEILAQITELKGKMRNNVKEL